MAVLDLRAIMGLLVDKHRMSARAGEFIRTLGPRESKDRWQRVKQFVVLFGRR